MISIKRYLWCSFFIVKTIFSYTGKNLIDAIKKNNFVEVQTIVQAQPRLVEFRDNIEATPLHFAAMYDYFDIVKYLIEHNASIDAIDDDKWTPLHFAAFNDHLKTVKYLIEHNASINAKDCDKETAYDIAANSNNAQIATYLANVSDYQKAIQDKKLVEFLNQLAQGNKLNELDDLFALALNLGTKEEQAAFYGLNIHDRNYKKLMTQLKILEEHDSYVPTERILSRGIKLSDSNIKELREKAKKNNNKFFEKALLEYLKKPKLKRSDLKDVEFEFN